MNNGGFAQYFFNSAGGSAEYAPYALRLIGAERCAAIVERAFRRLSPQPIPSEGEAREKLLAALGEGQAQEDAFEDCDKAFYAYPDDLSSLLFDFVRSQPSVFGPLEWSA